MSEKLRETYLKKHQKEIRDKVRLKNKAFHDRMRLTGKAYNERHKTKVPDDNENN